MVAILVLLTVLVFLLVDWVSQVLAVRRCESARRVEEARRDSEARPRKLNPEDLRDLSSLQ